MQPHQDQQWQPAVYVSAPPQPERGTDWLTVVTALMTLANLFMTIVIFRFVSMLSNLSLSDFF